MQFKVLARLGLDSPTGSLRMTELADEVVYSRSGLTYQAGQMEKAGWVERGPSPDDDRGVTVTITDAGRERLAKALPGHVEVLRELLFATLTVTTSAPSPPCSSRCSTTCAPARRVRPHLDVAERLHRSVDH